MNLLKQGPTRLAPCLESRGQKRKGTVAPATGEHICYGQVTDSTIGYASPAQNVKETSIFRQSPTFSQRRFMFDNQKATASLLDSTRTLHQSDVCKSMVENRQRR